MKFLQKSLHSIRKRGWKHKRALFHMDRAIFEMEQVYRHTGHQYDALIFSIHEIKMYRIQEYFEYKNALSILKKLYNFYCLKTAFNFSSTLFK